MNIRISTINNSYHFDNIQIFDVLKNIEIKKSLNNKNINNKKI